MWLFANDAAERGKRWDDISPVLEAANGGRKQVRRKDRYIETLKVAPTGIITIERENTDRGTHVMESYRRDGTLLTYMAHHYSMMGATPYVLDGDDTDPFNPWEKAETLYPHPDHSPTTFNEAHDLFAPLPEQPEPAAETLEELVNETLERIS